MNFDLGFRAEPDQGHPRPLPEMKSGASLSPFAKFSKTQMVSKGHTYCITSL